MAENSLIEWTDATWNPITGCTMVSAGCTNCYAMGLAASRMRNHPSRKGLTRKTGGRHVWTGEVRLNEDWLAEPLRWRRPRMIFVCAHGDLFHEAVPDEWIDRVFAVMALAQHHTFQVLTKRPERARAYITALAQPHREREIKEAGRKAGALVGDMAAIGRRITALPLPNVWLGTSIEDQATADARIPHLLDTPAAVRFVSAEPLLGRAIIFDYLIDAALTDGRSNHARPLDWVIVGGESGRGARPMHPDWARSLRDQCEQAGVPFFFKQWGEFAVSNMDAHGRFDPPLPARGMDKVQGWDGTVWRRPRDGETVASFMGEAKAWAVPVGKASAGRLLDGRTWDQMPGAAR